MMISFEGHIPILGQKVFVAQGAALIGKVKVGDYANIWFNAVLRGDLDKITIGARSNIQDLSMLHTDLGSPLTIEEDATVGHSCVLHGCHIQKGALIGMGSIILNNSVIGEHSIVGAGSLIPERKVFPPNCLILGSPAKVIRELSPEEIKGSIELAARYAQRAQLYMNP